MIPKLLTPRDREGRQLGIRSVTAALELDEVIYAGRDDRVCCSRDLFAPGGLDVAVLRSLESPRPEPVAGFRRGGGSGAGGAR